MVDAVEQEVQHEEERPIGQSLLDVEQETVQGVLEQGPDEVAEEETRHGASQSG